MEFIKYLLRNPASAIVAVVGGVITVAGFASDAYSFFHLGLPPMAWAAIGAALFMGSIMWMQYRFEERVLQMLANKPSKASNGSKRKSPLLSPPQERALALIAKYQTQFAASKLILDRKHGKILFDDYPERGAGTNLVTELFGKETDETRRQFESLIESIPQEYMRFYSEMRWDSPFVLGITDAGISHLQQSKLHT